MPQLIPVIVYYVATYLGATATVAYVAAAVAAYAVSSHQAQEARRKARNAYNASLTDRGVMFRSGVAPRQVVVGRTKVSGPLIYVTSTGSQKEFLHLVIAIAGHEVDGFETVYFNDIALPTPDGGGFITSGQFSKQGSRSEIYTVTDADGSFTLPHTPSSIQSVVYDDGIGVQDQGYLVPPEEYTLSGATITLTSPPPGSHTYRVNYTRATSEALVRIKFHRGQPGQVADADLVAESGGEWTSAHRGDGIAYLYVRLKYDQDVFGATGAPNIAVVVRGARCPDPRTGTTVWTQNSALITAWWLKQQELGLKQPAGSIIDAELSAAANVCDEDVDLDIGGTNTQKRYTTNGTLSAEDALRSNLEQLIVPMAGSATFVGGKWRIRAGAHEAPDVYLTESDFAPGSIQILPFARRRTLFNAVTGTYIDAASGYIERQFPVVKNATYQAADGGEQLTRNVTMAMVDNGIRAQRLAKIELERERQAESISATYKIRGGYNVKPNDVVALSIAAMGWTNKLFVVRERVYKRGEADHVDLLLQATAAGVWNWNYGEATTVDLAPNTDLPAPGVPPAALAGLTVETGSDHVVKLPDGTEVIRALVEWTASADVWVQQGGRIEIEHKRDDAATWTVDPTVPGSMTSGYAQPIDVYRVTLVRVRAVNVLGLAGPWTTVVLSTIDGDPALPTNVTGLTAAAVAGAIRISWNECPDIDYAVTEVRHGASWDTATRIFRGRANTYDWAWPAFGSYTLRVRHEDRSGILGNTTTLALTVSDTILVGTPHIDNDAATDVFITTDNTVTESGLLATTSYTADFDCKLVVSCKGTCENFEVPPADSNPRIKFGPYVTDGAAYLQDGRRTWRVQLRTGEDITVPMFERAIYDVPAGMTVDISAGFVGDATPDPNTFYTVGTTTLEVEVIKR
jgi:hypothetical protein